MTDFRGEVISKNTITRGQRIINSLSTSQDHAVDFTDDDNFYKAINIKVNVAKVGASKVRHIVTLESLYQKWLISLEAASTTVQNITKQWVRTILNPSLSRLFKTNEGGIKYNRLKHSVFNDTMQAGNVSRRGNRYAQVYSTEFGWSRAHPMKRKGDAHENLYLLFKRDGVLPNVVMDGSKE